MPLELGKFFKEAFQVNQQGKEGYKTPSPQESAKQEFESFTNEMESFYPSKDKDFLGTPDKVVQGKTSDSIFESIFNNLIQTESGGKQFDKSGKILTSNKGAQGITQVMPKTQKNPGYGVEPAKDNSQEELLRVGKDYLQALHDKFGDWELAVAAYNAGPGNVTKAVAKAKELGNDWKEHLPKKSETLPYIDKILGTKYSEKLLKSDEVKKK